MKQITVYTWQKCPYCDKAKAKLKELGLSYHEIDATPEVVSMLRERTGLSRVTVPQIYVGDYRVGGWDNLETLIKKNLFQAVLEG